MSLGSAPCSLQFKVLLLVFALGGLGSIAAMADSFAGAIVSVVVFLEFLSAFLQTPLAFKVSTEKSGAILMSLSLYVPFFSVPVCMLLASGGGILSLSCCVFVVGSKHLGL